MTNESGKPLNRTTAAAMAAARAEYVTEHYQHKSAAVIRELYKIAHERNAEVTALSWGGFNLMGDRKSIEEVDRLLRCEERLKVLEERLNG